MQHGKPKLKEGRLYQPTVSVLIPAYNEASFIRETIENKLDQNYPTGLLKIIVISDESNDGTDEIVEEYATRGVTLLRQIPRQGKSAGLNLATKYASGEILVFSDANSIYEKDTIRSLVKNFAAPDVGYVTGKMIYSNADGSVTGDGCSSYMRYENILRVWETSIGSVVGVDGGVDAIRRSLYKELSPDQLPDFVQPLKIVEQGYRVIYEPEAILRESALDDSASEYRMRVRVTLRALWALYDMQHLMNPFKFKIFSWQLISHKLLRYLAFIPLVLAYFFNLILAGHGNLFYSLLLLIQTLFYTCATIGHLKRSNASISNMFALPYYFVLLNVACIHATFRFIKGEKQILWTPRVG